MEWRKILDSHPHQNLVELHGLKNERGIVIGCVETKIELVPGIVRPVSGWGNAKKYSKKN
jgi:hypothetical protein